MRFFCCGRTLLGIGDNLHCATSKCHRCRIVVAIAIATVVVIVIVGIRRLHRIVQRIVSIDGIAFVAAVVIIVVFVIVIVVVAANIVLTVAIGVASLSSSS